MYKDYDRVISFLMNCYNENKNMECYVDKNTNTAFVEAVSTREKYRKKGLCKQMLQGPIIRLKEMGIERAYINSYDWRKKVYNSAGFDTEDSIGFWYKKIEM